MTVFKGYMRIMKKNTGLILLYLGIFFGVTMALQAAAGKESYTSYESEKIKIGVVDKDNGPLAEGLVKWLKSTHYVTMLEDDREKLQEELFYRNVEYIVVIPEDFYESCMVNGESISVTKVPGSYSAYYVDQQLESCLNTMRTYLDAGFSEEEAATAVLNEKRGEVTMVDIGGNGVRTPGYLYYFRYLPYLFLAVLCYVMGYVLMAFKKDDIPKRMQASAVSVRRQSLEGLLAMSVMGGGLWGIGMAGAILMYGKTFLGSANLGYYVLNTLLMMTVALSLSYLIGLFVKNSNMLSGIANILSLGMCFLCGVFVPMNIMDRNILKVSQFLPVYWYETVNETLGSYSRLTGEAAVAVWKGIGLEAMFAIVFVCMILAVTRYQRQK